MSRASRAFGAFAEKAVVFVLGGAMLVFSSLALYIIVILLFAGALFWMLRHLEALGLSMQQALVAIVIAGAFLYALRRIAGRMLQGSVRPPPSPALAPLVIRYAKPGGAVEEHRITPESVRWRTSPFTGRREVKIDAYFQMFHRWHSYEVKRIVSAADPKTGKVVDDVLAYLGSPRLTGRKGQVRLAGSGFEISVRDWPDPG